jgi:ABC-type sugar transport system ATPase subunit
MISSEIEEVLGLAHRVLVMRRGRITAEFGADPELGDVMEAAFGLVGSGA